MLICLNAEGVHGQRKVGNPWSRPSLQITIKTASQHFSTVAGFRPVWNIVLKWIPARADRVNVWSLLYILRWLNHYWNVKWTMKRFWHHWDHIIRFIIITSSVSTCLYLKTGILHEILTRVNIYICKISMPPSHPQFFVWSPGMSKLLKRHALILPEIKNQTGRKFDETCPVLICICNESKK